MQRVNPAVELFVLEFPFEQVVALLRVKPYNSRCVHMKI